LYNYLIADETHVHQQINICGGINWNP